MAETVNRYTAQGTEAEFEPGSRRRVLRNLAGIRSVREMARLESERLVMATERLIDETEVNQRFRTVDVRRMHQLWLGDVYAWAGEYRQVNIGKDGFMFAAVNLNWSAARCGNSRPAGLPGSRSKHTRLLSFMRS